MHKITISLKISKQIVIDITGQRLVYNRNHAMDVVADLFGYPPPPRLWYCPCQTLDLSVQRPFLGPGALALASQTWNLTLQDPPFPGPPPTCSNLFIMYLVQLASRRFASY